MLLAVLARPDDGNFIIDPPDVAVACDLPSPDYRELCQERGFKPVEPPQRTPEEKAAAGKKARLPSSGGTYPGVAALAGLWATCSSSARSWPSGSSGRLSS